MNKEVKIPLSVLSNSIVDQFASRQVLKSGGSRRQYRFDNEWTDTNPGKKPESTRIVMDVEAFRRARAVYQSWNELAPSFTFTPVFPERIIERLMQPAIVTLFIPWGVAEWRNIGTRERSAMDAIDAVRARLGCRAIANRVVLMPADLYATEVNGKLKADAVTAYFDSVTEEAQDRGYTVMPWSVIRSGNNERYRQLASDLTPEKIEEMISPSVTNKAYEAAKRNSGYTDEDSIRASSFAYLRERISEAVIIEETLAPIKLSMAPKNKDNDVDMSLPRLYILPDELVLPWRPVQKSAERREMFR